MNPPPFATYWARQLGAAEESLIQLHGGINNRVYKFGEGTTSRVVKGYRDIELEKPDRMGAEVSFLNYSALVAPNYVPRLFHVDSQRRCIIIEYLEGTKFTEGEPVTQSEVQTAKDFYRKLNEHSKLAQQMITLDAKDGFLRLSEHITNLRHRISEMGIDHLPDRNQNNAKQLLILLSRLIDLVGEWFNHLITDSKINYSIDIRQRCVSPSDFGFHNAIKTKDGIKFFDFEFSGWDDPAKTSIDFMLQPRVSMKFVQTPIDQVFSESPATKSQLRAVALNLILRLKWVCIHLAILRRDFLLELTWVNPNQNYDQLYDSRLRNASNRLLECETLVNSTVIARR